MAHTPETPDFSSQDSAQPTSSEGHNTPQYGEFGKPTEAAQARAGASPSASVTQGGQVAPPVAFPEQRGSTPQNLDPSLARQVADDEYGVQREGWAQDDPRYGGGTRNWATNEPANHSTGPAPEDDEKPRNPNVGKNDNPDEFSAFRPDEGRGIPGSGKEDLLKASDKDK
ncbi:hypothetical protein HNQ93_001610 [Hymenobacter luteus]|uniref:Uncharacterized protein n=2 Tax=Hymenobacter TaxID=89966 RepID=A0A7W9WAH4_9BACT|nr:MULTISPECIES: hypothetical protein [Hymenobacter]MBB4601029.1 hypothetical protein [Hymenobacter latericoloratus]MBB6058764.1 hypothetical protein [Hymenobacter luteus]